MIAIQKRRVRGGRVLVVDDDPFILRAVESVLSACGYEVLSAATGAEALEKAAIGQPELIVLDLTLPDVDGVEVCRRLRQWTDIPVLVLSVRGGEEDKIVALDTGADDYVTKPFSSGVLVARVGALLRRARSAERIPEAVEVGDLRIDFAAHSVTRGGERVPLTKTEFDILAMLATHPDRVVTSKMLLDGIWDPDEPADIRTLRAHVSNLRRKLEPHPSVPTHVITEPGAGFRFSTGSGGSA
jgi:two-component system KDP operon response regulator KdpE